jgi:hypothetical protein
MLNGLVLFPALTSGNVSFRPFPPICEFIRRTIMRKNFLIQTVSIFLCGSILQISPAFAGERIHCKSDDFRYQYCRVHTDNRVSLDRQISKTRCSLGDNWGYDRHGVWVDRGCEADFWVGGRDWDRDRHGDWDRDRDRDRDRDWDRGKSRDRDRNDHHDNKDKAIAIGAGIAGIGVLAAIAANSQHNNREDISSWAVGTFRGFDEYENTDVEVTILPGGSVTGYAGNNQFSGGLNGTRLDAGKHRFTIARSGNGFLATDETDSAHRIMFQRTGSGY